MRVHTSNDVTATDIYAAAVKAGVTSVTITEHRSRSHARAFELKITGSSKRRPQGGSRDDDHYAATWDQWGIFLAGIFALDPNAKCWAYDDAQDFHRKTGIRFLSPRVPADMHGDHTFRTGWTPYQSECTKCSAVQRWSA